MDNIEEKFYKAFGIEKRCIRPKDKRDNNENQCQCTCDECGAECEPFWKKEQINEVD